MRENGDSMSSVQEPFEFHPVRSHQAVGSAPYATSSGIPGSSDAKAYLELIRRNLPRLIVTALLAMLLVGVWLLSTDKLYQASALLRIEDDSGFMDKLLEKESNPFSTAPLAKEEAKVIRSRTVLGAAVDELRLTIEVKPQYFPWLGKVLARFPLLTDWIQQQFPDNGYAWGGEKLEIAFLDIPQQLQGKPLTLIAGEEGRYSLEYAGTPLVSHAETGEFIPLYFGDGKAGSILVQAMAAQPGTHFIIHRYSREAAIESLRAALTINARETGTRVMELVLKGRDPERIAHSLNEIVDTYRDLRLSWSSREARQELQFLKTRLPEAREQLNAAEEALAAYRKQHRSLDVDTESRAAISRAAEIEAGLKQLKMQRELLAQQYTPLYPELEKLDAEIASTESLLAQTRRKMSAMPAVGKDLSSLEREVEMRSKLYTSLEQRYQKLKVAEASSIGNVRLIDRAVPHDQPVWPRPAVMIPLAVLGALFLHLAWLFVRAAFAKGIRDPETLEALSGAPVYVDIPYSRQQQRSAPLLASARNLLPGTPKKGSILAVDHPEDFTVETLRGLRAMLSSVLANASNSMLMVCGPLPRMGKSFVSANLAVLLAETGKRVLLIDADFQRGRLHQDFGIANDVGLQRVIVNKAELEDAIIPTSIDGLDLLPRGPGGTPLDQDLDRGLRKIASLLGDYYHHIIVDAPPILSLSTAAIIGRVAGASIMVVRSDELTIDEMKAAVKRLKLADVTLNGCLVNNMNRDNQRHIYRYGYAS